MSVSQKVLNAAINGPEIKKKKIPELGGTKKHEFNVKPVTLSRSTNGELMVYGQISHHLRFRSDDQHWFAFKKNGNAITPSDPKKMIVKKEEGGLVKTITGPLRPLGIAIGMYFGVDLSKHFDTLDNHANKLSFLDLDAGYEKSIENYLNELARNLVFPAIPRVGQGLTLFKDKMFKGRTQVISVNADVSNLNTVNFDDEASSLIAVVPDGVKLEIFRDANFRSSKLEFGGGTHIVRDLNIHNLGDKISSIKWSNEATVVPFRFTQMMGQLQAS
ncbi:MAG: hypothetical protein AAF039_08385 [Bacteroidota bacterium]